MTTTENLRNIRAATSQLVHRARLVRPLGHRKEIPAPACMSLGQIDRMRVSGIDTDQPVTCKRLGCRS